VIIVAGRPGGFAVSTKRLADLADNGIPAYHWPVASYPNRNGQIEALELGDPKHTRLPVEMVFAIHTPEARNEVARRLGVALNPVGQIIVDPAQGTSVPGIYAAGDATNIHDHQVSAAVHEGNQAAFTVNYQLYRPVQRGSGES
jgi:thioredoxin reductase (NADPH)